MSEHAPVKGESAVGIAARVGRALADATLAEKVGMMSGRGFFDAYRADGVWGGRPYRAGGGIDRLGVPCFWFTDGPRGVARGQSTCFPCTMARGASFDTGLERRIGETMAIEARAQGCNLSGAVCINLLRHPAWGRAQETYGEDPHHLGAMAAALGTGIQAHNVCATVKHFALNSMENTRFKVDVRIDERTLHEIYLPHFKTALDAGVMSVMSAYNKINGEYCGQDRRLLTDILRGEWGFAGWVHSDWIFGVYQPYGATAGLDVENPEPLVFGDKLVAAVEGGGVEPRAIDLACTRILTTLYTFASADDPLADYPDTLVSCPDHVALAREAAEKSAVLLVNDGILPLRRAGLRTLAVLGRLADMANTGDNGSSRVRARHVVTPLAGLRAAIGNAAAIITGGEDDFDAARAAASEADAVVVIAGLTATEEGEYIPGRDDSDAVSNAGDQARSAQFGAMGTSVGGDRDSLALPADQRALIDAAVASGKPVVVVLVGGSAITVEGWHDRVSAILQTFYAGMEGGAALARLLLGEVSPAGRLPFTVAADPAHYPPFDKHAVVADYGYWHGYAKFAHENLQPRFAFGHGLSYTSFSRRALKVWRAGDALSVEVAVRNDGEVTADEVVFAFVSFPGAVEPRSPRALKAFTRLTLAPGETRIARLVIPLADLRYRDPGTHGWRLEPGTHTVTVARDAHAPGLEATISL